MADAMLRSDGTGARVRVRGELNMSKKRSKRAKQTPTSSEAGEVEKRHQQYLESSARTLKVIMDNPEHFQLGNRRGGFILSINTRSEKD